MGDTPPIVVVDASVAVKWFLVERERHVADAWRLLDAHLAGSTVLAAPSHLRLEVLNALRSRRVPEPEILRAADALEGFHIAWHPVDDSLTRSAATIAMRRDLTLYDAVFAALAVQLDSELITADQGLAGSGVCRVRVLGADTPPNRTMP